MVCYCRWNLAFHMCSIHCEELVVRPCPSDDSILVGTFFLVVEEKGVLRRREHQWALLASSYCNTQTCSVPTSNTPTQSSTCLPLPLDPFSSTFPLLSPLAHKFICATGPERFELRTKGLGCQVSTITFLTSLVTIGCTLFGVVVLYGVVLGVRNLRRVVWGWRGGWEVYGDGREGVWVRRKGWRRWVSRRDRRQEQRALLEGGR